MSNYRLYTSRWAMTDPAPAHLNTDPDPASPGRTFLSRTIAPTLTPADGHLSCL
ncbi:hypothetical protein ACGFX2_32025 [Streptomyces goshikiensis]|uniref:hypothetical protein n=1 Tax=Streptomyces goshikiensis TaxID=1942 RepID=UPI00371D2FB3